MCNARQRRGHGHGHGHAACGGRCLGGRDRGRHSLGHRGARDLVLRDLARIQAQLQHGCHRGGLLQRRDARQGHLDVARQRRAVAVRRVRLRAVWRDRGDRGRRGGRRHRQEARRSHAGHATGRAGRGGARRGRGGCHEGRGGIHHAACDAARRERLVVLAHVQPSRVAAVHARAADAAQVRHAVVQPVAAQAGRVGLLVIRAAALEGRAVGRAACAAVGGGRHGRCRDCLLVHNAAAAVARRGRVRAQVAVRVARGCGPRLQGRRLGCE
mmetsp:Transcript_16012/g.44453  ORF Transcript_16012/g.44453 Transcript_16012/m.44453 type:complete len:270 (-) Transcript_16012:59-868(-)